MLKGVCKRSTIKRRTKFAVCALALTVGMAPWVVQDARAAMVTFNLDVPFGTILTPPDPPPVAIITDVSLPANTVQIQMMSNGANTDAGTQKIKEWYFNVSDAALADGLTDSSFSYFSGGPLEASIGVSVGDNAFKADGDGLFDILFTFPTSGDIFGTGQTVIYDVTLSELTVADFVLFSSTDVPAGGEGPFLSAAHVLSIGVDETSQWVGAVPLPATVWIMGSGLVALGAFARRRRPRITG